jgi:uncharacterized phage protein (TIGR01671 family)
MNRPIKFRAQRSDNKEFVYGFYYKGKRADQNALEVPLGYARLFDCIITEQGVIYDILPSTVGQFTGLLDKNDREIYEGDIVQGIVPNGNTINHKGVVEWVKHTGFIPFVMCDLGEREVIGNIYENSNLLK